MALACVDRGNDFQEAEGAGQHVAGEEEDERLGVAHAVLHALSREIGRLHVEPRQPAQVLDHLRQPCRLAVSLGLHMRDEHVPRLKPAAVTECTARRQRIRRLEEGVLQDLIYRGALGGVLQAPLHEVTRGLDLRRIHAVQFCFTNLVEHDGCWAVPETELPLGFHVLDVVVHGIPREQWGAGEELEQDHPVAVNVPTRVGLGKLLHASDGDHTLGRAVCTRVFAPHTPITNANRSIKIDEHVPVVICGAHNIQRLEVTVHNTMGMQVLQRESHLSHSAKDVNGCAAYLHMHLHPHLHTISHTGCSGPVWSQVTPPVA